MENRAQQQDAPRHAQGFYTPVKIKRASDGTLDEIKASLVKMEESGKADMGVLVSLDELGKKLAKLKSRWIAEPDSDGFYFYLAARSTEMILGRMRERFENSAQAGNEPKIASDSLTVLEPMDELLDAAGASSINERSIDTVLERTQRLLSAATDADLREHIETCRAMIDKDLLKSQYSEIMKRIV